MPLPYSSLFFSAVYRVMDILDAVPLFMITTPTLVVGSSLGFRVLAFLSLSKSHKLMFVFYHMRGWR